MSLLKQRFGGITWNPVPEGGGFAVPLIGVTEES